MVDAFGTSMACCAALLSKENAVAIPFILAVVAWLREHPRDPRSVLIGVGLSLSAVAGFLAMRAQVVSPLSASAVVRLATWLPSDLFLAFGRALWPFSLHLEQDVVRDLGGAEWTVGLLGLLVTILVAVLFAVRHDRRHAVLVGGLVVWGISVTPSLFALEWTGVFAPRYLYLPTIGIALSAGYAASLRYPLAAIGLAVWLSAAAFATLARTTEWKDGVTLWAMEVAARPTSSSALINLASLLEERGDHERALPLQLRAAKVAENKHSKCNAAFAYSNAANILAAHFRDDASALAYFEKCVGLCPEKAQNAWIGIASVHARAKKWSEAERALLRAESLGTQQLKVSWALGSVLAAQRRYSEALVVLTRARALALEEPEARRAIDEQLESLRLRPDEPRTSPPPVR
jgi:hypothetical protein